jgi:hypothetical protein
LVLGTTIGVKDNLPVRRSERCDAFNFFTLFNKKKCPRSSLERLWNLSLKKISSKKKRGT